MAKYRYVHCEFWEDPDMLDYTPEEKFFYLYVLTNPHTKQCGIYEISIKQMAFETGFNRDTIKKLIERFEEEYKKIKYNFGTKEIVIKNWGKYNLQNTGKPIIDCVKEELKKVKDKTLIKYIIESITKNKLKDLYINKLDGTYTEGGTSGTQKEKEKEKENKKEKGEFEEEEDKISPKKINGIRIDRFKQDNGFYKYPDKFEDIWKLYPRKKNKKKAWIEWKDRLKEKVDYKLLLKAVKKYAKECKMNDTQQRYIKYPQTFLGSGGYWQEYLEKDNQNNTSVDEKQKQQNLEKQLERAKKYG